MSADASFFQWVAFIWQQNWPLFLRGAGNTLLIALTGTITGFVIGMIIGVIRTIPIDHKTGTIKKVILKIVDVLLLCYIEVFRGTPMMVQAMVIFYGIPIILGFRLDPIPAGIVIVSINTGAYMAEIVRGGILSIDKGQFEAAHAIGMTHAQTMSSIILPQAVRNILPATSNEFVINIKDTCVLSVISISELFFNSKSAAGANFRYFETFLITCIIYLIMTATVTRILRWLEQKLDGPSVYTIHGSQTVPEAEIRIVDGGKLHG
ncbi:MAG TPA: amino acid ABC transporter permease [Syntrophomonadaceae bacterium]|jgi:putative lysine transport system permease protein|nr:amino acid ABC transporter permease [Syntrophomonadaceae bacterium]HOQ10553.1 amino acid ABC transporter permease [Syntrophomonadaceae bacterium]